MKPLVIDVETTTSSKGNPFDANNKLCLVGLFDGTRYYHFDIEYSTRESYRKELVEIRDIISNYDTLVGFNIKFDLHWLRRYGIDFSKHTVWDSQLADFIFNGQSSPYPSLDGVADRFGLGNKLNIVSSEYWSKGIDTPDIPYEILEDYLKQDLKLTWEVYQKQKELVATNSKQQILLNLSFQDLLVLQEMEWNGMKYDIEKSKALGTEVLTRIRDIDSELVGFVGDIPINFNSNDHLSALLYGGTIFVDVREPYEFKYKDGRTKIKERWVKKEFKRERLVIPIPGTELAKEGYWSTAEEVLLQLRPKGEAKKLIKLILERSLLDTKVSRYYHGIPKKYEEKGWQSGIIHGQLNQVVARTGRLSSSDPNMQNMDGIAKQCFISRFT